MVEWPGRWPAAISWRASTWPGVATWWEKKYSAVRSHAPVQPVGFTGLCMFLVGLGRLRFSMHILILNTFMPLYILTTESIYLSLLIISFCQNLNTMCTLNTLSGSWNTEHDNLQTSFK